MQFRTLGATPVRIAPLVLGGNVFGWTADRTTSFAILDAFLAAGFNAIDTADVYNRFAPGLAGGESETVIGQWMRDRGVRDRLVVVTKGGLSMGEGMQGLGREYLTRACEASLRRLQTDHIDIYMAHLADPTVSIDETLSAFEQLIRSGKVRVAGCSNYDAAQLDDAVNARPGCYQVYEPHYNLADRRLYEGETEAVCTGHGLGVIAYYALASGFLTGKYRHKDDVIGRPRGRTLSQYFDKGGLQLLSVVDNVANRHSATPAQVALAWLMAQPSITAPIASATSVEQLREIMAAADLVLTAEDLLELGDASSGKAPQ